MTNINSLINQSKKISNIITKIFSILKKMGFFILWIIDFIFIIFATLLVYSLFILYFNPLLLNSLKEQLFHIYFVIIPIISIIWKNKSEISWKNNNLFYKIGLITIAIPVYLCSRLFITALILSIKNSFTRLGIHTIFSDIAFISLYTIYWQFFKVKKLNNKNIILNNIKIMFFEIIILEILSLINFIK